MPIQHSKFPILILLVLLLSALLVAAPGTVEAHANYAESDPAANSVVEESPERVTVRFTEPLEPALSEIQVFDSRGDRVDRRDSAVDPSDPLVMSVSVESLADGTYTVAWKNVSTVDGHRVRGAFVFSVGAGFKPAPTDAAAAVADQPLLQSPAEPVIRWLVLLGGLSLVGAVTFHLLVSRPVLKGDGGESGRALLIAPLTGSLTWLVIVATAVLLAASAAQLIVQASVVFESSLPAVFGGPLWELLLGTEWGRLWLWRVALATASGVAATVAWRRRDNLALASLGAALGAASLLTISLTSHAAATVNVRTEAILNDFIHLVSVAVWVGGLLGLALAVRLILTIREEPERRETLSALVRRFSLVAGISIVVIILTGMYSAWAQVVTVPALQVPYGRVLTLKVAVVAGLLLVAAANLIWVRPRLHTGGGASRWLKRLVAAEIVLATLVLLSVGFLTAIEPARQVASREGIGVESGLSFEETAEGTHMKLEIDPGQVGPNTVAVSLKDMSGSPIANATDVRVRLSYLDADFGETPLLRDGDRSGRVRTGRTAHQHRRSVADRACRPASGRIRRARRVQVRGHRRRWRKPGDSPGDGYGQDPARRRVRGPGLPVHGSQHPDRGLVLAQRRYGHGRWHSGCSRGRSAAVRHSRRRRGAACAKPDPSDTGIRRHGDAAVRAELPAMSRRRRHGRRPRRRGARSASGRPYRPCAAAPRPWAVRVHRGWHPGYCDGAAG